jgi:2,3-bisphosphoglycerate-independent phosphoglycerate mutase
VVSTPPHDHPNEEWKPLLVKPMENVDAALLAAHDKDANGKAIDPLADEYRMSAQQTADLLNELILKSQEILESHPFNVARKERDERMANIIWPI